MESSENQAVCALVRLKPGALPRVRSWAAHLNANRSQALLSLAAEAVSIESVFLHEGDNEAFLVYYMRAASITHAQQVARESTAAIEQFHKEFKREAWESVSKLELLIDLKRSET